jgi:hypothetical protein
MSARLSDYTIVEQSACHSIFEVGGGKNLRHSQKKVSKIRRKLDYAKEGKSINV